MMTLIATAGLFLLLNAEFVMGVQYLVYVGGVVVLFLFVIMLSTYEKNGWTVLGCSAGSGLWRSSARVCWQ